MHAIPSNEDSMVLAVPEPTAAAMANLRLLYQLGAALAHAEMRIVLEEFHRLIPEYSIAPGAEPEIVFPSGTFHLKSLPLVFPASGAA